MFLLMAVISISFGLAGNFFIKHFELSGNQLIVLVRDLCVFLPLAYAIGFYFEKNDK